MQMERRGFVLGAAALGIAGTAVSQEKTAMYGLIGKMLAQPGAVEALRAAPDALAIHAALSEAERRLEPPSAV